METAANVAAEATAVAGVKMDAPVVVAITAVAISVVVAGEMIDEVVADVLDVPAVVADQATRDEIFNVDLAVKKVRVGISLADANVKTDLSLEKRIFEKTNLLRAGLRMTIRDLLMSEAWEVR